MLGRDVQMCESYGEGMARIAGTVMLLLGAIVLHGVLPPSGHAAGGYFLKDPLFQVKGELVLSGQNGGILTALIRDEVARSMAKMDDPPGGVADIMRKGEGSGENEYRSRSVYFRISRFQDSRVERDPNQTAGISMQGLMQSIPSQFGSESMRGTVETLGGVFTPQLDLSIEF